MIYSEAKIENGRVKVVKSKTIDQTKLTSDCWLVQFNGLSACTSCELKGTDECGGGKILKKLTLEEGE